MNMISSKRINDIRNIILLEHMSSEEVLDDLEIAFLIKEFPKVIEVAPTSKAGIYCLKPKHYVGFISLPSSRIIELRPKIEIDILFAMIAKANFLDVFKSDEMPYTSVPEVFEFIVTIFLNIVEDIVNRGILRGFVSCQDDILMIRGKLLITDSIRKTPVKIEHSCMFDDFTPDITENRIIKAALLRLAPFQPRVDMNLQSRIHHLIRNLSNVNIEVSHTDLVNQMTFHRMNQHYKPALYLATMIMSYLSPSGSFGSNHFLSFIIDMNQLFERYVTEIMRDSFKNEYEVSAQKAFHLDYEKRIQVKPDIIIYKNDQPILIIDMKYKLDDDPNDYYQVLAYCHALDVNKAILVYPDTADFKRQRFHIKPKNIEIILNIVKLKGNITEFKNHSCAFLSSIREEIDHTNAVPREQGDLT